MKKLLVTLVITLLVVVVAIFGVKTFLFPDTNTGTKVTPNDEPGIIATDDGQAMTDNVGTDADNTVSVVPNSDDPIKTYDNGLATFTYDSTQVFFSEMPSDSEDGYPITMWQMIDGDGGLPFMDTMPLTLTQPFPEETGEQDWDDMIKALLVAYYAVEDRENVQISITDSVVKVDGDEAKAFANFTTTLDGSATPNLTGCARMVSDADSAVVMVALAEEGNQVPQVFKDIYMSAELY